LSLALVLAVITLSDDDNREHGRDERVGVQDYYDALAFNYQLVRALAY